MTHSIPAQYFKGNLDLLYDRGFLPFTKSFRKIRSESKWNKTFWIVPAENFREQRNIRKCNPVFPDGIFQRRFVFRFFKAIFNFDTRFRPSQSFSGKWN